MSVQELFDFQENTLKDWIVNPRAWLLQANPVWGSHETVNRIALFDTKEAAEAYLKASELPEAAHPDAHKTADGYSRTFRPDSLLWDYNKSAWDMRMVVPAIPWHRYDGVARNPAPPSGPIVNGPKEWSPRGVPLQGVPATDHPRYGRDFDQGYGGPYNNMDGALPGNPPAAPRG